MCGAEGDALWAPFFAAEAERRGVPVTALEEELIAHVGAPKPQRTASVDWTALAAWYAAGAASTVADPPAPAAAAGAALPAVRFDSAQQLTPPVAKWLDAVLGAPVHGWPHPERRALDEKVLGCDMRTAARPGMEGRENFLRWGGPLPPNLEAIHQVAALWPTYRRAEVCRVRLA